MKKFIFILFIFFIVTKLAAQVNLQTGSAVFSLPVFNWQDDKSRLNSVVALSYNSGSGLKVNDVASNVGQGWNLIAGGMITRMQVGEPDDQMPYGNDDGNDRNINKYPPGLLYATAPVTLGCPLALARYPIYKAMNQVYAQHNSTNSDRQLDYFSFQFNGKTGMFVLDPVKGIGQPLGDTKMKISFQKGTISNTRTTITSFTIKDVDGLTYKFAVLGKAKVLRTRYCNSDLLPRDQPKFKNGRSYYQASYDDPTIINPWIVGNWYLSEISDSLTQRKVTFTYYSRTITNTAGTDISFYNYSDYTMASFKTSIVQTQDIASIAYPDGHTVSFNNGNPRADLNGEMAVGSIDVMYQGRYLSKYLLNTTYFILNRYGTPVFAYQRSVARLCLRSVQKIGVDLKEDTPPYLFDYYKGSDVADDFVPPPFFYAKDAWGYYNGNKSQTSDGTPIPLNLNLAQLSYAQYKGLCFLRNNSPSLFIAKPGYAKNGLLKQIIYPTGGTLTYQYVQNRGVAIGTGIEQDLGGVQVSQTSSTDGGYSATCANPIITRYNYILAGSTNSSLWGAESPDNSLNIDSHYEQEQKKRKWYAPWSCTWGFTYPGLLSMNEAVDLTTIQQIMITIGPALGVLSTIGTIVDVVNLICLQPTPLIVIAVVVDMISAIIDFLVSCNAHSKDNPQIIYNNYNLNDVSPLPTQFKRVEVVENPGTIGKTVYDFTSSDDYPLWLSSNPHFSTQQRFASWAYGLPKLVTVYDANNNIVRQTKNVYNFGSNNYTGLMQVSLNLNSCKCTVNKSISQRSDQWTDPSRYNNVSNYISSSTPAHPEVSVDNYTMYTGRALLDTTYERVYKQNSTTLYDETATGYYYNVGNYEVAQSFTLQSNGDIIRKYFNYSNNYGTGVYATLASVNNIALPVETITNIYRASTAGDPGGSGFKANAQTSIKTDTTSGSNLTNGLGGGLQGSLTHKITEYLLQSNGDIKPARVLEERFTRPGSIVYYNPSSPSSTYKTTQSFTYDANGNLTGLQDEGKHLVTNLYDYNDKYITASVINADPVADKCAYTSFETTGFGSWTLTGSGNYNSASAITGSRSYTLTAGSKLSVSSNTAEAYLLSFWAKSSGIAVTGGTLAKSAPTYNGFTYYEYIIPQGTATVTIVGTVAIDELRLYPANARMRTTTYDPLIGKTSECDENNRIIYYEYDNLGRLQFVKDEAKNALKMYEYNNISAAKQNGCPATYSNHAISEVFMKATCSTGYLPDSTVFTVAAGTYTSSISQADADAQVENYILTNGQNYANAQGACRLIYYNTAVSETDTTQSCDAGQKGGLVTYTVPAKTYSSIINQADADRQAAEDIAANAQAYANSVEHQACTITTAPDWTYYDGDPIKCQAVSGSTHEFVLMKDENPNSSSYGQTLWVDIGTPQDACPVGASLSGSTSVTLGQSSGSGKITAPAGYTVTGTITASGTPAGAITATIYVAGVSIASGSTTANNSGSGSSTFTFVMPSAGTVSYTLSVSSSAGAGSAGSGSITVH